MSGVFGLIAPGRGGEVPLLLDRMAAAMSHGPGIVCDTLVQPQHGLGLGRIGIGVFNQGTQPMWGDDRQVALLLTGEFFYHRGVAGSSARGSDEEYALAPCTRNTATNS